MFVSWLGRVLECFYPDFLGREEFEPLKLGCRGWSSAYLCSAV